MSERIADYLGSLKRALAGADPALVQDALGDAEDHLRTAHAQRLADDPGASADEMAARVIDEYGSPAEVAAGYRQIESAARPSFIRPAPKGQRSASARFFGVFVDPGAYAAFVYMLFSLASGIFYFTWATTGLSLSLGMIVLIIGLPVTALFLLSVQGIALVEGRIVEALLGVRMPRRPLFARRDLNMWERFKVLFTDKLSWTTILYMIIQLPLGTLYFTVFVTFLSLGLAGIAAPVVQYGFGLPLMQFGNTVFFVPLWLMPLFVVVGFLWILLTLHLAKALGKLHGSYAKALLVRG